MSGVARLMAALVVLAAMLPASGALADSTARDRQVTDVLARAVEASRDMAFAGSLTVVSFGERGPQITEVDLTRGDRGVRVAHDAGWELGRVSGEGFLRSSDLLLRVGGVERLPAQLHRLRSKYDVVPDEVVAVDTGPALPLRVTERQTGIRREVLYVDERTGLIVRRETFGVDGAPVRLVAFTDLDVGAREVLVPAGDGRGVQQREFAGAEVAVTEHAGFVVPDRLPGGYELFAAVEVVDAQTPTLHLVYGDGLYTLSLFQQPGRLAPAAVRGTSELTTPDGGTVWRWPGSEPRRLVWNGDGSTFTALTDAPVDEVINVLAGLPTDAAPSILDRLGRGIGRVGQWLWPMGATDGLHEPE